MVAAMPLAAADAADAPRAKPGAAPQQHVRHLPHPANGAPDAPKQQPQQHSQQQQSLQQQLPHPAAFAGSVILVRSPQGCLRTDLSPAADAHGSIPVHGGISAETAFDTDLFSGECFLIQSPGLCWGPKVFNLMKRSNWTASVAQQLPTGATVFNIIKLQIREIFAMPLEMPPGVQAPRANKQSATNTHNTHTLQSQHAGKIRVIFKMPPEVQAPRVTELLAGKKRQMWLCIQVLVCFVCCLWDCVLMRGALITARWACVLMRGSHHCTIKQLCRQHCGAYA